ncbi:MAG: SoxR reducing system RseC family protein [Thermodesulfovibrionales bacterium]|nr:SoxR reducing system RseC family protein [Thermodesulfovibrionales bacterium]
MKPSIPETGKIIRLEGDTAVVMLHGGESCKGCGQAKIGLCKSGELGRMLNVKNTRNAKPGDTVKVGLNEDVKKKAYLLSFIIPVISLIAGTLAGYFAGRQLSIPSLDVISGFIAFIFATLFSLKRLKALDAASSMVIKEIVSDNIFSEYTISDEEKRYL